jgi:hypothetical protein
LIEAVLLGFPVVGFLTIGGADNPVWFYLAMLLQFPASLLWLVPSWHILPFVPHVLIAAAIVIVQFMLIFVLLHRPWMRA